MKCWCHTDLENSFHPDYFVCPYCGTFVSKLEPKDDFYNFDFYWHEKQTKGYGFPAIEERAKVDFFDRIPFWWNQIKMLEIKSVLEIGAGHGGFLYYCKKQGVERVLGVEISEGTCEFARQTFDIEMIKGNFPSVAIEEKFDIVCGFDVFEHLLDPVRSLHYLASLGKYIMLQIPCYRGEGAGFCHFNSREHMFIFNELSILRLFDSAGIKILSKTNGAFHQDLTIVGENK